MKKFYLILLLAVTAATSVLAQPAKTQRLQSITLNRPVVKPATGISATGFTANWEPVAGAEAYCVYVYTKDVAPSDGEYSLADEDFNGITSGSIITPAGGDEYSVDLSAYGYAFTYGWEIYAYPTFAPSLVAGLLYSPYLYLVNNDGNYKVILTTLSSHNDEIRVESHGTGEKQVVTYQVDLSTQGGGTGLYTKELEFNNGSRDLFFSTINVTAPVGQADYTDRVQVVQELKAGDEVYNYIAADEAVMAEDDWGFEITSKQFTLNSNYLNGHTQVYYDVYAATYDYSTPNGSVPYTLVTSPYSQRVLVDLVNHTSQVLEDATAISDLKVDDNARQHDDAWYDLTGRRVANPTQGIYIHGGKKVVVK